MNTPKESLNILVVEDDATVQLLLKTMLSAHRLTVVGSGEEGVEAATQGPDLVILDIGLPGIDGYETCRQLRASELTRNTPIIFLSSYSALEDRLQAYGAGGNDYISKPFDTIELHNKIDFLSQLFKRQRDTHRELQDSHRMVMGIQTAAAKLQGISRFIQSTLYCHDIDTLLHHFFVAAREIGLSCVLRIDSVSGIKTRSSDGKCSALEREILDMSSNMDRIHSFGEDRAIFRWGHATLLVRQVKDMIDTAAIFMDALEAGIKAVDTEYRLLKQVESLGERNSQAQNRVASLLGLLNDDLKNAILSLGLVSALDVEDEDRLNDMLDDYGKRIDAEFQSLGVNNQAIQQLVTELRTPPPELQNLMDSGEDDEGAVMLF